MDGKEIIGEGSSVEGHVAFVKQSGRVSGVAQMRVVLDDIITPDDVKLALPAGLDDMNAGPCAKTNGDDEGTIKGCGKNKKDAAKDAAIGGAMGAGAGSMVGMGSEIDCQYYGNCGGPGFGASIGMGAGIGAGTVLIYDLLKHEKHIILVQGTTMTFVISRSVDASTGKPLEPTTPTEASQAIARAAVNFRSACGRRKIPGNRCFLFPEQPRMKRTFTLALLTILLALATGILWAGEGQDALHCPPELSWWSSSPTP